MRVLPQALEIIFWSANFLKIMNKTTTRKTNLPTYKNMFFVFFLFFLSLFGHLLFSNLITFLFLIDLKQFKVLQECQLKFYKSNFNSNNNKATYKEFLKCFWKPAFVMFGDLFFFLNFWPLLLCETVTFSFLIHFWQLLVYQMRQEEGFKFCFDTINNKALPLDPTCPEHLSVWSPPNPP
jgi:hypothetical protein